MPAFPPLYPSARLAVLAIMLPTAALAAVPTYTQFELQARTNLIVNDDGWNLPPGSSFNSISASINNEQTVAFPVQLVPIEGNLSNTGPGLWVGSHGSGSIAFLHEPPVDGISDRVSINADGNILYYTYNDGSTYRLWRFDGGTGLSSSVNLLPLVPTAFSGQVLSDTDVMGYRAGLGSGYALVSTDFVGSWIHVADSDIQPGPYAYIYTPSMNNGRRIASKVSIGDFDHNEIRTFAIGGSFTTVAVDVATDPGSPFRRFDNSLAYNDAGQVAVSLSLDAGNVRAIYRFTPAESGFDATEIARVEATGTIRAIESFAPAINENGLVVFRARDANGQAIYAGDGESLKRVVGKADAVTTDLGAANIGQHIDDPSAWPIFSGAPGVNDNGDIAFIAALHPAGDNQVEWGSGVFVAYAAGDLIFSDGFESP